MFCEEWCLVKRSDPCTTIVPLRCKCWTCEECHPRRRSRLIAEAMTGYPNTFITLTSRRQPGRSPNAAAQALVNAWRAVRSEYIKRNGKRSMPFLAVFEATKKGWPHLHIIARTKWVDQDWLSKRMGALTGSPIVDVRRIKTGKRTIGYVTKYVGKKPHRFQGVKRYWRSLDYMMPSEEEEDNTVEDRGRWEIVRTNWIQYAELLAPRWMWGYDQTTEIKVYQGIPP